jgi:SpoVK/Ycf46/Vps4 family AAA+-type ATPase
MGLPTEEALNAVLDGILQNTSTLRAHQRPDQERRKALIDSAKGLTTQEAESAFSLAIVEPKEEGKDGPQLWDPKIVMREKCLALRKNGILEYIAVGEGGMGMIGGLDNLKEYVAPLQRAFTPAALEFGLTWPKGILLVGPPGAGKSLGAKAISSTLNMPLLKLDMGRIFQSLVGSSEANIRLAIRVAEAIAPCILWLDEIEKGVSGASAGALDSGVSARVLGTLLTWMQEKQTPVFVYATANDVTMLPPELLRKGRFDEMFSVDIPTPRERKEILDIHIRKRGRGQIIGTGGNKIDLDQFSGEVTDGFTGAEIEGAIEQALRVAFHNNRDLNSIDLMDAFDSTSPISKTMQERLDAIRKWCAARTRPANRKETTPVTVGVHGRKVDA